MDKHQRNSFFGGRGDLTSRMLKAVSAAVFLTALGACSSQLAMHDPSVPDPLIENIPISVAVRFPDTFEHFIHEEQVIGKETWTIDLGRSNALLYTKLFRAMFNDVTVIDDDVDPRDMPIDALIEPSIDAFELAVPSQSQIPSFAVWIRYRIKFFDSEGKQLANWPVSAYGKSLSKTLDGDEALRQAVALAMRDAAALIIMQMDKVSSMIRPDRQSLPSAVASPVAVNEESQTSASEHTTDETG